MKIFAITFALSLIFTWQATALDDGLYWISDSPTNRPIDTLDGRIIFLAEPFSEKIDEINLISQNNANTEYVLELKQKAPYARDIPRDGIALALQKRCLLLGSGGGDPWHRSLWARIVDPEFIAEAKTFFKIVPQDRKHPGHQFTARFVVDPKGYALAGPVTVTLEITNCGTKPFSIPSSSSYSPEGGSQREGDPFAFTALRCGIEQNNVENLPRLASFGGLSMSWLLTLKPQDTRSIPVDLKHYLKLDQAGTYSIRGSYAFQIHNPDSLHSHDVLWDDFATAEFQVKIK